MLTLDVEMRSKSEDLGKLRRKGLIPAVFYGKNVKSTPISIKEKDFIKVWRKAGESSVVTLKDSTAEVSVLIHDVAIDPVKDVPIHADFYVFEKGKKVEVSVPLEFVGVSPAIKDLGGTLVKALHELKISAEPQNLPHQIEVDISSLADFTSQILAGDLNLPKGVDLIQLPHEVVAAVSAPKEEEVEEVAPVDLSTIEVEKKGKKDEEGEAPAEEAK